MNSCRRSSPSIEHVGHFLEVTDRKRCETKSLGSRSRWRDQVSSVTTHASMVRRHDLRVSS
jgi:hypothetical protein